MADDERGARHELRERWPVVEALHGEAAGRAPAAAAARQQAAGLVLAIADLQGGARMLLLRSPRHMHTAVVAPSQQKRARQLMPSCSPA